MIRLPIHPARIVLIVCLLLAAGRATAHAQRSSLTLGAEKRRYIVYVPKSYAANPQREYALVLNFHGGGMTMAEQMLYTQMNHTADRHDFIVVYPQGIGQDWNVGFDTSYQEGTDDVGFTDALLDRLKKDYRVDVRRVYATGLSRGGFFCHRLAAEMSHRFAAIAAVGATLPNPVEAQNTPRGARFPIGVMLVHGTADLVVTYGGKEGSYFSGTGSYSYWKNRNGLTGTSETTRRIDRDTGDSTAVTVLEATGSTHAVTLVTIHDGGHTWAGADPFNVGLPIGLTSRDVDLNEVIWRFFVEHRR